MNHPTGISKPVPNTEIPITNKKIAPAKQNSYFLYDNPKINNKIEIRLAIIKKIHSINIYIINIFKNISFKKRKKRK